MIQLKSYGNVPKSYHDTKINYITARNTMYGVHRNKGEVSKTHIVCFTDPKHATTFKDYLVRIQAKGVTLERSSNFQNVIIPCSDIIGSKFPLHTEHCSITDLMIMCHLNFFDMIVVFDMMNEGNDVITLHYYDYESTEYPNRGYLNLYLNKMLGA